MKKIIKKVLLNKEKKHLKKVEKKLLNHNDWIELTKEEKEEILPDNRNLAYLVKNVCADWNHVDKKYLISDYYYKRHVLPKLNAINYNSLGSVSFKSYFTDKNYEEKVASNFKFPKCVIRCIDGDFYDENFNYIVLEEAKNLLNNYDKLVFKRTFGAGHGKNVLLSAKEDYENNIKKFGKNFVVQVPLKQHDFLSNFNSSSVNVIRITSVLWEGQVYILSGILRVGAPGSFCDHLGNASEGPRIVALDDDGNLIGKAINPDKTLVYDDLFGKEIRGQVPVYDKMKKLVREAHNNFIHHKIIGWDLTVNDKNEVVCIEFNSICPGIVQSQMCCGTIFNKKTVNGQILLDEILRK